MELHEANRILRTVKSALFADGYKLPPSADTDGLMMLLDKLDPDKFLAPKIKHARAAAPDSAAYKRAYGYIAFFRALVAAKSGLPDPVTSMSIMLLHKTVCGDLDPEAGKPRGKELLTNGSAHTDPKYISGSLKSIVTKMNDIESAPATAKEDFAGYLSHYMRELLIMHPFERGSELTVRLFVVLFCKLKGFALCFYRTPPTVLKSAEDTAFMTDDVAPLYKILINCLTYERTTLPQRTAPRTRREINNDLRRPQRPEPASELAATRQKPQQSEQKTAERPIPTKRDDGRDAPSDPKQAVKRGKNNEKSSKKADEDVLRRAIRLQQKISKLNEQLTELIQPLDKSNDDK